MFSYTSQREVPTPPLSLNGAGMFISGGPNGDNGLSGKKLVVDAYGPGVPIGSHPGEKGSVGTACE